MPSSFLLLLALLALPACRFALAQRTTPNTRITTLTECYKKGRQIDCAWNPQVLQNDGFSRVCEPTQSFLGIVNATEDCVLDARNNYTCAFDSYSKCASRSETQCIEAPLWTLFQGANQLLVDSSTLTSSRGINMTILQVLDASLSCTLHEFNTTCAQDELCEWAVTGNTGSLPVVFSPTKQTDQLIWAFTASALVARRDVKRVSAVSPNRAEHLNTITITASNTAADDGFYLALEGDEEEDGVAAMFAFNASALEMQEGIAKLVGGGDVVVTQNQDDLEVDVLRSWVVRGGENVSRLQVMRNQTPPPTNEGEEGVAAPNATLDLGVEEKEGTGAVHAVITRHARTVRAITLTGQPLSGTFAIQARGVRSAPIAFNATARDVFLALREMEYAAWGDGTSASGLRPVFDFVSVSRSPTTAQAQDGSSSSTVQWLVEYTDRVAEYEPDNLHLSVTNVQLFQANQTRCCAIAVSNHVQSPVLPTTGYSARFFFAAPRALRGGLFLPRDSFFLHSSNTTEGINTTRCLRYRGRYYSIHSFNATAIRVREAINALPRLGNDTLGAEEEDGADMRRDLGWGVFPCIAYEAPTPRLDLNATEAVEYAAAQLPQWITSLSMEWESPPNEYGEFQVLMRFESTEGLVPELHVPRISESAPQQEEETFVQVENVEQGASSSPAVNKKDGGSFRALVFFNASLSSNEQLKLYNQVQKEVISDTTFGQIWDNGALVLNSVPDITSQVVFTRSIASRGTTATTALDLVKALTEALPASITVTTEEESDTGDAVQYLLRFTHPKYIERLPLLLLTESELLGSNSTMQVFRLARKKTEEEARLGWLLETYGPFERARNTLASPCRMNPALRRDFVNNAYGDFHALRTLDAQAEQCAELGGQHEDACVGGGPRMLVEGCAWRGPSTRYNFSLVNLTTVHELWASPRFSWGNNSFALRSNCTVDQVVVIRAIVNTLKPLRDALKPNSTLDLAQNNATASNHTSLDNNARWLAAAAEFIKAHTRVESAVSKFEKCATNPTYRSTYSVTAFVDVWSTIFLYTGVTCMLFYSLAGTLLAYRMDKFKLMNFKLQDAVFGLFIIACSATVGAGLGFVMGAIPAALVSQMYASVPVQLSDEWAISLGVAQGLLIVYFDMGRGGGAGAELAFKNGE